jgi:hypothetical protein
MNDITTFHDLLMEKEKLETALAAQKQLIHQDFLELKDEFRPAIDLLSKVSKITDRDRSNPLIAIAVTLASEIFLKNMLFSKSGKVVQFTIPFIAKKAVTYLLSNGIGNFFSLFRKTKTVASNGELGKA